MDPSEYHGGFQHPVRAFLVGCGLVVLLLAGWAIGVEAGGTPASQAPSVRIVTRLGQARLQLVTVTKPVLSTVVSSRTRIVHLPGVGATHVVIIREGGRNVIAYLPVTEQAQLAATETATPLTVWEPQPAVTVTSPGSTVTVSEPGSTVTVTEPGSTVTVTEPPTSDATSGTDGPPSS